MIKLTTDNNNNLSNIVEIKLITKILSFSSWLLIKYDGISLKLISSSFLACNFCRTPTCDIPDVL